MAYTIEDPRPTRAANPYSFHVPCAARLAAITPSDFVKAMFKDVDGQVERMWVEVTACDETTLEGVLANQPLADMGVALGDAVKIPRTHVIAIETMRADDPAETNDNSRFFERCLVDARIDAGEPIARLVRDEPEPADYPGRDRFGWSGWRFEAAGHRPGMAMETYALVVPLRLESGYADMLDAPVGTVIERDGDGWRIATPTH